VTNALQCSILVIEDDPLIAMDLASTLNAAGYRIMGPVATNAEALQLLHEEVPDVTVLDINLGSEMSFPVFDYLSELGAAYITLSGHSHKIMPSSHAVHPFLQKPYDSEALLQAIQSALRNCGRLCAAQGS
jgi:DNA-binding response OmpR family regulator